MRSIKIKKIEFGATAFRKLGSMVVPLADRITIIAGHNGIGKSTIMALIANNSGLTSKSTLSLFDKTFQANLFDIAHIDHKREFKDPRDSGKDLPSPKIECLINNSEVMYKTCSLTERGKFGRVRVVPRNSPLKPWTSLDKAVSIGRDAKVPLPTIYLGMIRMLPVGEANSAWVKPTQDTTISPADAKFIADFVNDVLTGGSASDQSVTSIGVKGTRKYSKQPQYAYDARCISLGQDSLGSIATALASFHQLSRSAKDYPGGLLVIDEIDSGLHPAAQLKLIKALKKHANTLRLQILATTHSNHIIEAVHPDGTGNSNAPDSVIYLTDTKSPKLAAAYTLKQILADMSLRPPAPGKRQELKVYFEDEEAATFFKRILTKTQVEQLEEKHAIRLKPIPLGVGGGNLAKLSVHDKYFERVVALLDADGSTSGMKPDAKNIIKLPGGSDASGAKLSPERTLLQFVRSIVDNSSDPKSIVALNELIHKQVSTDQLTEHIIDESTTNKRESLKAWWKKRKTHIKNWRLIELWAQANDNEIQSFLQRLDAAIAAAKSA